MKARIKCVRLFDFTSKD